MEPNEIELPLGLYSTLELNIEVILRVDIKTLRALYCKYPIFRQFLSNQCVLQILSDKKYISLSVTSFKMYYIYNMMRYHPTEIMIPKNIITKIGIENDDPSLFVKSGMACQYIPDLINKKNRISVFMNKTEKYSQYLKAYYGTFPIITKDNDKEIIFCATRGGYIDEIIERYKNYKTCSERLPKVTHWFCKALVQKYESDYVMIEKYVKQWINKIYFSTYTYKLIYYAAAEVDNIDVIHKLIEYRSFELNSSHVHIPRYYGSALKTIKDMCKNGNIISPAALVTIVKSKDVETLTWILDNNLYDKIMIKHGHYGDIQIPLYEYYQNNANGIVKLLLSKYKLRNDDVK